MRRVTEGSVPAEILTFDPAVWPGDDGHDRWCEAREEFHRTKGWPGGEWGWASARVAAAAVTPDEPWTPSEDDHRPPRGGSEAV